MGLTLHYSVRLRDMKRLPELVSEVEDICKTLKWDYYLFDDTFEVPAHTMPLESTEGDPKVIRLKGILFSPTECEPVFLTFTPDGWSSTFLNLQMPEQIAEIGTKLMYWVNVKTQYAGEDIHIALVHLLKYLEKKYFSHVEVDDEGNYWETMDKAVLHKRFGVYNGIMNMVASALETAEWTPTDNPNEIAKQLEDLLKNRFSAEKGDPSV
jgi:hypothetical protein